MSNISSWSTTAASNNSASPDGFPEGMAPSGVNDSAREVMASVRTWYEDAEWIPWGDTTVYVAATQFKISGSDVTARYSVGRRVRAVGSVTGTIYGTITVSSFSTDTTVTVSWDASGNALSNETLTVSLGSVTRRTSPGLVMLGRQRASASSSIDFTANTHPAMFDSTYSGGLIVLDLVKPATDDCYLYIQIGTGATPTWQASLNAYTWGLRIQGPGGGAEEGATANALTTLIALTRITAAQGIGNATGEHASLDLRFNNLSGTNFPMFWWQGSYLRSDGVGLSVTGGGNYATATAVTGIRLGVITTGGSGANVASGSFTAYGVSGN